jgi:hypothetical protein
MRDAVGDPGYPILKTLHSIRGFKTLACKLTCHINACGVRQLLVTSISWSWRTRSSMSLSETGPVCSIKNFAQRRNGARDGLAAARITSSHSGRNRRHGGGRAADSQSIDRWVVHLGGGWRRPRAATSWASGLWPYGVGRLCYGCGRPLTLQHSSLRSPGGRKRHMGRGRGGEGFTPKNGGRHFLTPSF